MIDVIYLSRIIQAKCKECGSNERLYRFSFNSTERFFFCETHVPKLMEELTTQLFKIKPSLFNSHLDLIKFRQILIDARKNLDEKYRTYDSKIYEEEIEKLLEGGILNE